MEDITWNIFKYKVHEKSISIKRYQIKRVEDKTWNIFKYYKVHEKSSSIKRYQMKRVENKTWNIGMSNGKCGGFFFKYFHSSIHEESVEDRTEKILSLMEVIEK